MVSLALSRRVASINGCGNVTKNSVASPCSGSEPCPHRFTQKRLNLEISLFERLERAGHPVHMLTVQYRMHPEIRAFPSGELGFRSAVKFVCHTWGAARVGLCQVKRVFRGGTLSPESGRGGFARFFIVKFYPLAKATSCRKSTRERGVLCRTMTWWMPNDTGSRIYFSVFIAHAPSFCSPVVPALSLIYPGPIRPASTRIFFSNGLRYIDPCRALLRWTPCGRPVCQVRQVHAPERIRLLFIGGV